MGEELGRSPLEDEQQPPAPLPSASGPGEEGMGRVRTPPPSCRVRAWRGADGESEDAAAVTQNPGLEGRGQGERALCRARSAARLRCASFFPAPLVAVPARPAATPAPLRRCCTSFFPATPAPPAAARRPASYPRARLPAALAPPAVATPSRSRWNLEDISPPQLRTTGTDEGNKAAVAAVRVSVRASASEAMATE